MGQEGGHESIEPLLVRVDMPDGFLLAGDLLEYHEVHPFAVHLHAHNFARSVTLKHYRGDKELRNYGELKPFHG